jgi:hypothetical protein
VTSPCSLHSFLCIVCILRWHCVIFHVWHDRSNLSSPSFSNSTFQEFQVISYFFFGVSKLQHRTQQCSKCSSSLVSSFNSSLVCWWQESSRCILSFGWFPGDWVFCADVSEHCSFFIGRLNKNNNWDEIVGVFIQQCESLKSRRDFLFHAAFVIAIHVVFGILEPEGGNGPWRSTKCVQLLA